MLKIGIIREGKTPPDKRVAFSPEQAAALLENFNALVQVQPSPVRGFSDEEYGARGLVLKEDLGDMDILFGVKEVKIKDLIPAKTYLFFSHTIKKQPYNRDLMKAMIEKKITLIDYECLRDAHHNRIIGFGYYAGLVGAYNGIRAYGLRNGTFSIKPAHECFDKAEMFAELHRISLPPVKVIITGTGRVGTGAFEIMKQAGIIQADRHTFEAGGGEPMYHVMNYDEFYTHPTRPGAFDKAHFYTHSHEYVSVFAPITRVADLFISCHYWDGKSAPLFTREDMRDPRWTMNVIADVTCDIEGSVPTTIRPSTIAEPLYGMDKTEFRETEPFAKNSVTVMAVDNLPCELPRDASAFFGKELTAKVLPLFIQDNEARTLERATILKNGELTEPYEYLRDYAWGN
ncbi:MAG: NAD(P)-dependent oxidoreductase [Flavobacteriales bacterium]